MNPSDKVAFLALIDDDPHKLMQLLEFENETNLFLSLKDVETPPLFHDSPPLISIAIYLEAFKCISALLIHSSNLTITDSKGRLPIHFAAACNQISTLAIFQTQGADLAAVDSSHRNILHYATLFDHFSLAKWIIAQQLPLKMEDSSLFTPLHFAVERSNYDLVSYLLSLPNIQQTKTESGWTPLLFAAKSNK